jgi:hypothetical protein
MMSVPTFLFGENKGQQRWENIRFYYALLLTAK